MKSTKSTDTVRLMIGLGTAVLLASVAVPVQGARRAAQPTGPALTAAAPAVLPAAADLAVVARSGPPARLYEPCVVYRHRGRKLGCEAPVATVLLVKDPGACCVAAVPVCLPPCCLGDNPKVCERCGLLGRGVVRYDYCCGVSVVVTFKKCGDVIVTYVNA